MTVFLSARNGLNFMKVLPKVTGLNLLDLARKGMRIQGIIFVDKD